MGARLGASKREAARLASLVSLLEDQVESLKDELLDQQGKTNTATLLSSLGVEEQRKRYEELERELQLEKSATTLLTRERDTLALIVQRQQEIRRADLMDAQLEVALRMRGESAIRKPDNAVRSPE